MHSLTQLCTQRSLTGRSIAICGALAISTAGHAQCPTQDWSPLPGDIHLVEDGGSPAITESGHVGVCATLLWHRDGPNQPPILVIGGTFDNIDGLPMNGIAAWDGANWSDMAGGMNAPVFALAETPNGELIAAGAFSLAGGVPASRIARWSNGAWSPLGDGITGAHPVVGLYVAALAVTPNGEVIAGGQFTTAGGVTAERIARWNGSAWSAVGTGSEFNGFNDEMRTVTVLANGDAIAGGVLSPKMVMRWNGSSWSELGSPAYDGAPVSALAAMPNGALVVADTLGQFRIYGNGAWSPPAPNVQGEWAVTQSGPTELPYSQGQIYSIAVLPNSDLLLGGRFLYTVQPPELGTFLTLNGVARFNGQQFVPLGTGMAPDRDLVTTNQFRQSGTRVYSAINLPNGGMLAGGAFALAGGVEARGLAGLQACGTCCSGDGLSCTVVPNAAACVDGVFNRFMPSCTPTVAFAQPSTFVASVQVLDTAGNGNGNGLLDAGESAIMLDIPIGNYRAASGCTYAPHGGSVSAVTATLTSRSPTVSVVAGSSTYPDMAYQQHATNIAPFVIAVNPDHPCEPAKLRLTVASGVLSSVIDFELPTGKNTPACAKFAVGTISLEDTTGNGNANGWADPGENHLLLTLPLIKTDGEGPSTAITGVLTSTTPGVTVLSAAAAYPDLMPGQSVSNTTPFIIALSPEWTCKHTAVFRLEITTDGGRGSGVIDFIHYTTGPEDTSSVINVDPPGAGIAIADNNAMGINVLVPAPLPNAMVGSVDLALSLTHPRIGDLVIKLISPQGVTCTIMDRPGFPDPCLNANMTSVRFKDSAAQSVQEIPTSNSNNTLRNIELRPVTPLSVFTDTPSAGAWTLNISDRAAGPASTTQRFTELYFTQRNYRNCQPSITPTTVSCCRGTTCNNVAAGTCMGTVAGSLSLVVTSCGAGDTLATCCYADFNHDGTPSIDDLFLYFNAYFTGSPCANVGGDGAAAPTIDDLFLYINGYFSGCS